MTNQIDHMAEAVKCEASAIAARNTDDYPEAALFATLAQYRATMAGYQQRCPDDTFAHLGQEVAQINHANGSTCPQGWPDVDFDDLSRKLGLIEEESDAQVS